jgi:hypothetical protein
MPLDTPNLDDWDFDRLFERAQARILERHPEWDSSPSNPGTVLLDAFAHLTDVLWYRLNRLPQKAYVEFLRLLGIELDPPSSAGTTLRFATDQPVDKAIRIPEGTRVTVGAWGSDSNPPVFRTVETVSILPGATSVDVEAFHCDRVDAELVGHGTGVASQSYSLSRPPVIRHMEGHPTIVVGIELDPSEVKSSRQPAREHDGKTYGIWREVSQFGDSDSQRAVYVLDRVEGRITFAPSARMSGEDGQLGSSPSPLADYPAKGREIRVWYLRGGGAAGNVVAGALTVLKDGVPGLSVINARPTLGGCEAETLDNALVRGPQELSLGQRAVTASDFEFLALRERGAVARAKAFTKATLWHYAQPGMVEVHLVPAIPEAEDGVTVELLGGYQARETRERIQRELDVRRPLGVTCEVRWADFKSVGIQARVIVRSEEDGDAVALRLKKRLQDMINPLPREEGAGWEFGEPLHVFQVYDLGTREPGVRRVENVCLTVDDAPDDVAAIVRDPFQEDTFYAGCGAKVFRTLNAGEGWERVALFPGEEVVCLSANGSLTGMHALATRVSGMEGDRGGALSKVRTTTDCGATWDLLVEFEWEVRDLAWFARGEDQVLLVAGAGGLREIEVGPSSQGARVLVVDSEVEELGVYAVAASGNSQGEYQVAVAADDLRGVYISREGGRTNSFAHKGLKGLDVRVLEVQSEGDRTRFWAGTMVPGGQPGEGCRSWDFTEGEPSEGWREWSRGWAAGGCKGLTFVGSRVYAATVRKGVVRLDRTIQDTEWSEPSFAECGLPLRDPGRLDPVQSIAVDPRRDLVMAAGPKGVFRSADRGESFSCCSSNVFEDRVTLPPTWLFSLGELGLEVVYEA